ncbi:MAG TPA: hypothetical protein VGI40_04975 [Pirellulaceae bacterium]
MYEPPIRSAKMNDVERGQFVRKAKADRLAYEAAELLSLGEMTKAATLAGEGTTLAGREQLSIWLRHYATTRFKITTKAVDEFLSGVPLDSVAL